MTTDFHRRLGLGGARRVAILHADDVGMCHGANTAFLHLFRKGALTSGSVMVPCPWFPEIARIAAEDRSLDLGVHLTLTSEWAGYRWAPLTRPGKASGLVDAEGYFPRTVAELAANVDAEAAEAEMRAQVDRALAFGMQPTHIDTHMGGALCPRLVEAYCRVGADYRLPVLLPRRGDYYARVLKADAAASALWREAAERLDAGGMPLVDDFRMTPGVPTEESDAAYRALAETLPEGITFVAVHPNAPGDIETIVPPRAHFRTDEHRIFGSGQMTAWLAEAGVPAVGMRPFLDAYREALDAAAAPS
jgi:predicted glycoside hydrolase/deacetylase ChbG (UPF0249 family)